MTSYLGARPSGEQSKKTPRSPSLPSTSRTGVQHEPLPGLPEVEALVENLHQKTFRGGGLRTKGSSRSVPDGACGSQDWAKALRAWRKRAFRLRPHASSPPSAVVKRSLWPPEGSLPGLSIFPLRSRSFLEKPLRTLGRAEVVVLSGGFQDHRLLLGEEETADRIPHHLLAALLKILLSLPPFRRRLSDLTDQENEEVDGEEEEKRDVSRASGRLHR